jgi:hypothetical protein
VSSGSSLSIPVCRRRSPPSESNPLCTSRRLCKSRVRLVGTPQHGGRARRPFLRHSAWRLTVPWSARTGAGALPLSEWKPHGLGGPGPADSTRCRTEGAGDRDGRICVIRRPEVPRHAGWRGRGRYPTHPPAAEPAAAPLTCRTRPGAQAGQKMRPRVFVRIELPADVWPQPCAVRCSERG